MGLIQFILYLSNKYFIFENFHDTPCEKSWTARRFHGSESELRTSPVRTRSHTSILSDQVQLSSLDHLSLLIPADKNVSSRTRVFPIESLVKPSPFVAHHIVHDNARAFLCGGEGLLALS